MKRLAVVLLAAGCAVFVGPDDHPDRAALFERVWWEVDRHYSFFEFKQIDWDSLHDVYAPQAAQATTDLQLATVIGAMLNELRDVHVNLYAGATQFRYTGYDARPVFFDPSVVRTNYVTDRRVAPNRRLQFGHLASDVGYVWIPSFGGSGAFGSDLETAFTALAGVTALVIDVRSNGGGSDRNGREIAGRFADRARLYAYVQYRSGPGHGDFTTRVGITLDPAGTHFAGPVVVLANRSSYSSTEDFVLAMRQFPAVTLVGDSTGGGSGNPLVRELPNGWTFRFSQWVMSTAGGEIFEERGLTPAVFVRGSDTELMAGRDAMLDTALAVARRAVLSDR